MRLVLVAALFLATAAAQTPEVLEIRPVAGGFQFAEGPVWWPSAGGLLFSDIPGETIFFYRPDEPADIFLRAEGGPNGNALDAKGRLYTCEGRLRRVVRRDPNRREKFEVLASHYEGKRLNEPNDIVVRGDGHIYFTDPAFGTANRQRDLSFYGVYHIDTKGRLNLIARPEGRPNGIALSPGGRQLYVANTDERNIRVYELDREGKASQERILVEDTGSAPDGMATDDAGNIYVAASGILVYSPEGRLMRRIELPERPSNCAFGGRDFQSLFVTARSTVYEIRLNVKGSSQHQ